jgi:hypothetical protein
MRASCLRRTRAPPRLTVAAEVVPLTLSTAHGPDVIVDNVRDEETTFDQIPAALRLRVLTPFGLHRVTTAE